MTNEKQTGALFDALYQVARTVNSSLDIMQVLQMIVASTGAGILAA